MQKKQIVLRIFLVFLSIMIAAPPFIFANEVETAYTQDRFSKEELDQMLAPIALYPDTLLAQILMAATYPLEVVAAARWVGNNQNLNGDLLDQALQEKDWDVSVQSLAHFPQVLSMMDEKIEWTTRVGDAFLAQKDDVMNTIQDLRAKADAAGNLTTTREQQVIDEGGEIMIEPADPGVIYVPVYDPFWVYGPWWYPAYPPYAFYYPGVAITSGFFGFAFGFSAGFGFGWCDWDWHHHDIRIDYDRIGHFHRFDHNRFHGRGNWEHNPDHRRGVAYWDRTTSHRFGQSPERSIQGRREVRGYADVTSNRQNMVNHNRPEINRRDFHSQEGVRGNESGFRERSEKNDRVVRERHDISGLSSNQGSQSHGLSLNQSSQSRHEQSGLRSTQQGVRGQRSSAFSGFGDGKNARIESNRGRFSRESSRGGFQSRGSLGSGNFHGSGGSSHGGSASHGGGSSHGGGGSYSGGGRGR